MSFHAIFCEERRELHELRQGTQAQAGHAALPHLERTEPLPERTRADFMGDDCRMGVCLCCGEKRSIPHMMHVCLSCHNEQE